MRDTALFLNCEYNTALVIEAAPVLQGIPGMAHGEVIRLAGKAFGRSPQLEWLGLVFSLTADLIFSAVR